MLIPAVIVAILVCGLAILSAIKITRRSESPLWISVTWIFTAVIVLAAVGVASTATTTVRTAIVMAVLDRREPFATMLTDRPLRLKVETAVRRGLEMPGVDQRANVEAEVRRVINPYMAYRISSAGDRLVVSYARLMLDNLKRADKADCNAIVSGDMSVMSRHSNPDVTQRWVTEMLRSPSVDQPRVASSEEVSAFVTQTLEATGVSPGQLTNAGRPATPDTCTLTMLELDAAMKLPEAQAASLLRGMSTARTVVVR